MPRIARTSQDIALEKERILEAASDIICETGFNNLSMRKLARRVDMTATNLYNYYAGKDELYLDIQTRGFEIMTELFATATADITHPFEKIRAMIQAYLDFGRRYSEYYDIIFSWNTPKFADYLGTPIEPTARIEKNAGLQVAAFTEQVLQELHDKTGLPPAEDINFRAMQLWTSLHGIVNLINSRVLQEVVHDPQAYIERVADELLLPFTKTEKGGSI